MRRWSVGGRSVRARCRARSSWVRHVEGRTCSHDDGTVLGPDRGPTTRVAALSRIWVAGVVGTASELATGHPPATVPLTIVALLARVLRGADRDRGPDRGVGAALAGWVRSTLAAPGGWIDVP